MNTGRMSLISFALFFVGCFLLEEVFGHWSAGLVAVFVAVWALSFIYAMYLWLAGMRYGDPLVVKLGVRGTAQVLSAKETSWQMAAGEYYGIGAPNVWKYGLEVSIPDKQSYKTTLYICAHLQRGQMVPVLASRLNRKRVAIDAAQYAGAGQQYIQEQRASAAAPSQAVAPGPDITEQLTRLADLRDRGVLSQAEFDAEKVKLLRAS
ncbi:MAG: SHOCT domain-containing protein [Solirubrobacteraceae bacterium]